MKTRWKKVLLGISLTASIVGAYRQFVLGPTTPHSHPLSTDGSDYQVGFPAPGRWRLNPLRVRRNVVLWLSHLVIAHNDSVPMGFPLRPPEWAGGFLPPRRTRSEAASIANRLYDELQSDPNRFYEYAKNYSDDPPTSDHGGRLGGIRASGVPAQYLDALEEIGFEPGVTRPFESPTGFHLVKLEDIPERGFIAGTRILLRHEASIESERLPDGGRSRERALQMAEVMSKRVQRHPEDFESLLRKHSMPESSGAPETRTWFVRDPQDAGPIVELLTRTLPGNPAPPIETPWGVELWRRDPLPAEEVVAVDLLRVGFDSDDSRSRRVADESSKKLLERVQRDPSIFDVLRAHEYCCDGSFAFRKSSRLGSVASEVQVGGFALVKPAKDANAFIILRRRLLTAAPAVTLSMPTPARVQFEDIVRSMPGDQLGAGLHRLLLGIASEMPQDAQSKRVMEQLDAHLTHAFSTAATAETRVAAMNEAQATLRAELGDDRYGRVLSSIEAAISREIMAQPLP